MANYCDHTDIEQAKHLTAASGKQYSTDQATAIDGVITWVHGQLIDLIGSEPTDTNGGLKALEVQATLRHIWNTENPDKKPMELFSATMIEQLNTILMAGTSIADLFYAKETY